MAVQGHSNLLTSLHTYLPSVSAFIGPYSVGRWTVAEHLRWRYNIDPNDVLRVNTLDVEAAGTVQQFILTSPANSEFKLVIVELYKASAEAQAALVPSLENPRNARIIVVTQPHEASQAVLQYAVPYRFRYLSASDVSNVLIDKLAFSKERAEELGSRSGGQVSGALSLSNSEDFIDMAKAAILALRTHDPDALEELAPKWTEEATGFLAQWCIENLSDRWRVFDEGDKVEARKLPLSILMALRARVRPRLVVRSQLMSILKGTT